jgi:FKBP-type peptidyl-prolyl cis-trans isomerase
MKPGDVWHVYIPPEQGYGDRGGSPIPPGSVLVFKVEMLGVLPQSASANG